MFSGEITLKKVPVLCGDFSLIPVGKRLEWRDALSRHLLLQMRLPSGLPLPIWKIQENIVPMNLSISGLLGQGLLSPGQIIEYFELDNNRNDYNATGK